MYVLDTNTVSALMRGELTVVERLARESRTEVLIPQAAVAEIAYGIARLRPSKKRLVLEQAFSDITQAVRRADWTDEVSARFGEIKAKLERRGQPIEDLDIAVAAHALAYDATLATANLRHFERVPGLTIEDWSRS